MSEVAPAAPELPPLQDDMLGSLLQEAGGPLQRGGPDQVAVYDKPDYRRNQIPSLSNRFVTRDGDNCNGNAGSQLLVRDRTSPAGRQHL